MQLNCTHCPYVASSLLINHDAALSEISNLFAQHISTKHPDKQRDLVKSHMECMQIAMWIMMIANHTTYLEDMEKRSPEESIGVIEPLEEAFDKQVERMEELVGIEMFGNRPTDLDEPEGDAIDRFEKEMKDESKNDLEPAPSYFLPPDRLPR